MAAKLCQYSPAALVLVAKFQSAILFICVAVHSTRSSGMSPKLCSIIAKADFGSLESVEKFLRALKVGADMKASKVFSNMTVISARSR
jgi:hypothetical protein